ncbi:MAG TPA: hypothetical protein VHV76_03700, partial [Mycobacteriales bacterium]|nr:hypothetical protein [Mycobacteriales bacterium]
MNARRTRTVAGVTCLLAAVAVVPAAATTLARHDIGQVAAPRTHHPRQALAIKTLSVRADLVSGH